MKSHGLRVSTFFTGSVVVLDEGTGKLSQIGTYLGSSDEDEI